MENKDAVNRATMRSGDVDLDADAFERALIAHLTSRLGLSFVKKRGTNSEFYEIIVPTSKAAISVVGPGRNTATPPGAGVKWLLRVEGAPPDLVNELEAFFKKGSKLARVMPDGMVRLQWKSTDYQGGLLP